MALLCTVVLVHNTTNLLLSVIRSFIHAAAEDGSFASLPFGIVGCCYIETYMESNLANSDLETEGRVSRSAVSRCDQFTAVASDGDDDDDDEESWT